MAEDQAEALNEEPLERHVAEELERQLREILRGAAEIHSEEELRKKLVHSIRTETPLRVKLGVDPTAHDLHLGFTVPLGKMRIFQDLGHQAVLIIGDATAMVGDPSGRNKARPQLTKETVDEFSASYLEQAGRVLDLDRCEVRRNSEWLHELGFTGLIQLAAKATVAQMLTREDFAKRFSEQAPISLHELIYPLMQGWDSVVIRADVELGGTDQLFNLHVGRDLQSSEGMAPQVCLMGPLIVGLDGTRKMSKSFGNYIGIAEPPDDMFGKLMSVPDEVMRDYFELCTQLSLDEIEELFAAGMHPRDLKDRLARTIVTRYHDESAATRASEGFRKVFTEKQIPDDIPDKVVPAAELEDGEIRVARLVAVVGFAPSNKEARRLVEQGGVSLDGEAVSDPNARIRVKGGEILKVGKRRFGRLGLEA